MTNKEKKTLAVMQGVALIIGGSLLAVEFGWKIGAAAYLISWSLCPYFD